LGKDGVPIEYEGEGPLVVVPTMAGVLARWLTEHDATMAGSPGELRRSVPVRSHPALIHLSGRDTTWTGVADTGPLDYGLLVGEDDLLARAATLDSSVFERAGIAARTARRIRARQGRPRAQTHERVVRAIGSAEARRCAAPRCTNTISGRRDRVFCSTACRKAARRAVLPAAPEVRRAIEPGAASACSACGTVLLGAAAADRNCIACGADLRGAP
jgi:hypothetical protein